MENNMPLATSKRAWHIVKVLFFMLRKGICKRKLMVDLNMMLKRGKIAGKAAIGNIISHHHHGHATSSGRKSGHLPPPGAPGPHEYEFSCSNTPAHNRLPWKPRRAAGGYSSFHNLLFGCTHVPETREDVDFSFDCQAVVEILEKSNNHLEYGPIMEILASPLLPGFGRTPKVRQLRITDSPFPIKNDDEDDYVDKAAEEFIAKFYKQLRQE